MNQYKRSHNITGNNCKGERKNKLQRISSWLSTITTNRDSVTSFEDLSDDLINEIFGYLDAYHIYESFSNLNIQLENLLTCSTIPISLSISSLSKFTLENYYTRFIRLNKHRIQSLYLSSPFAVDFFSSSTEDISKCSQLQTLVLDNIPSYTLENLMDQFVLVPNLSSLAIHINHDSNKMNIYHQIFQLPLLKHCHISFDEGIQFGQLPMCTNPCSPLKHLVILGKCYLNELNALLSYVPQLRRFAVTYINAVYNEKMENDYSFVSNHLTAVSLTLDCVKFDNLVQFVRNHFSQVKVLYISTARDMTYLEADRWEQLILSHMPHLQIFDFHHTIKNYLDYPEDVFETLFRRFDSPFWHEKQWFFTHDCSSGEYLQGKFYSIQPYRRKSFSFASKSNSDDEKTILHSVHHVIIQNDQMLANCSKSFPNTNELTLSDHCSLHSKWFSSDHFHRIIPLTHLNKLTTNSIHLDLRDVVNILFYTPNVQTLAITFIKLVPRDYVPLQTSEIFRLVSDQNKIQRVIFTNDYSLKMIQLLIHLCPKLHHLTVGISPRSLEPTIRFLLSDTEEPTCRLSLLCIVGVDTIWIEKLKTLIESERLLHDYSIKTIGCKFYLWW